jgi:hypothetical protein
MLPRFICTRDEPCNRAARQRGCYGEAISPVCLFSTSRGLAPRSACASNGFDVLFAVQQQRRRFIIQWAAGAATPRFKSRRHPKVNGVLRAGEQQRFDDEPDRHLVGERTLAAPRSRFAKRFTRP